VSRIKKEWPNRTPPLVLATGGLASLIKPYSKQLEVVDPFLTLKGIRRGFEILSD
jgi:type III pantothenate kinase